MSDQLADLLQLADLHLLGGDAPAALDTLREAIDLDSHNPEPHYRRAEVLISLGSPAQLNQAIYHLFAALDNTTSGQAALEADIRFFLLRAFVELDYLAAAQDAYIHAIKHSPDNARLREWGIRLAVLNQQLPLALQLVQQELADAPTNYHWLRWSADLRFLSGDYPAAIRALTILLDEHQPANLTPGDWHAATWGSLLLKRAEAARKMGAHEMAAADLNAAAALLPDDPAICFNRGLLAWAQDDNAMAFNLLKQGLQEAGPDVRTGFWEELVDYPRREQLRLALNQT